VNDLVIQKKSFHFEDFKKKRLSTNLIVSNYHSENVYDFLDFLYSGMNMTLVVGIDFTASNKDPEDPSSLHFLNPPNLNLYQQSILSIGEIM